MVKNLTESRFIPESRNYTFEIIIWFIEMGKSWIFMFNFLITFVAYNLLNCQSVFYFIPLFLLFPLTFFTIFVSSLAIGSYLDPLNTPTFVPDWNNESQTGVKFVGDKGKQIKLENKNKKMPMEVFVESYLQGHIEITKPTIQIMLNRYELFTFVITIGHVKWFFGTFLQQLMGHSIKADHREVGDVYNRGNDFYNFFLGESMVYTSGIFHNYEYKKESLEVGQDNKLRTICETTQMKPGMDHLDIGCGWGTLVLYAAKYYGTNSTGCTLATEQVNYAKSTINKGRDFKGNDIKEISKKISWIIDDYRNIPKHNGGKKYDVITCVEMAEHVGIKKFQAFLTQVRSMLKDDGLFYIQMCGVRRTWHFEDMIWILFMGKYIFPGADASTPINFIVQQLERSGFELHRLESLGCHYARTIQLWHENWVNNKEKVLLKYGKWWYRLWDIFLSWSTMIGRQHSSNVYMITANKNSYCDQNSLSNKLSQDSMPRLNRTKKFIGPKVVSFQQ